MKSYERQICIEKAPNKSTLTLPPLPNSGLLLSYFCNDEIWLQNVYIPYFNKSIEITLSNDLPH